MADVEEIVSRLFSGLDSDVVAYIISVLQDLDDSEKRQFLVVSDVVCPFLLDSSFVEDESAAEELCRKLVLEFGGSGYKTAEALSEGDVAPALLSAPIRMIDSSGAHI